MQNLSNYNALRLVIASLLLITASQSIALPQGFVYLSDIAPEIQQDMRYASSNNFTGQRVAGYDKPRCILTLKAAKQLAKVQKKLKQDGYALKVYDCYRPKQAVKAFYQWSQNNDQSTKAKWYPREIKKNLFKRGYIAHRSGHSRGSTVDLTMVRINKSQKTKSPSLQCFGRNRQYINDNSINMGTRWDCLDIQAHIHAKDLTTQQRANRKILQDVMKQAGFTPYSKEWWHFTLKNEPYPKRYFDFQVR